MSVNIKPLADRVVVKPSGAEETTKGGIIIPDTAKEKPQSGIVVAVGPGKADEPTTVKVGDTVNSGKIVAISETAVAVETKDGVQRLEMHRQIKRNSATQ